MDHKEEIVLRVLPFGQDYEKGLVSDLKMLNWLTDVEVFKVTHEEYPEN